MVGRLGTEKNWHYITSRKLFESLRGEVIFIEENPHPWNVENFKNKLVWLNWNISDNNSKRDEK